MNSMCEKLVYGKKCKHGHVNENGLCIRFKQGGTCCRCGQPTFNESMDEEIELYYNTKKSYVPKELSEERKKRRSQNSMRWTAKNKDRAKEYQQTYYYSEAMKAKRDAVPKKRRKMTPEELELHRLKRKPAMTLEEQKQHLFEMYEKRKADEREKYARRTKEEKDALRIRRSENKKAKILKDAGYDEIKFERDNLLEILKKQQDELKS